MKKNNILFITLTGASVVLISAIMADNITFRHLLSANPQANTATTISAGARSTETLRRGFKKMGLPLHEGRYWKESHE